MPKKLVYCSSCKYCKRQYFRYIESHKCRVHQSSKQIRGYFSPNNSWSTILKYCKDINMRNDCKFYVLGSIWDRIRNILF